jgi:pyruvate carboxylase
MTLPRPIRRLLIANRGEIAARLISAAQELSITPIALYTATDTTHARFAPEAVALASDAAYVDMDALLALCSAHNIDAVHPGYGFLSESAAFVERAASAGVLVVGPSAELLAGMADKVEARRVAGTCGVPVLPALEGVVRDVRDVKVFAERVGWPVMVKAVDGGGGRGIRLVRAPEELDAAFRRAVEESPSKSVFAEKAAVDGFLHVEVQVVGDGKGNIVHLLERQCSVQRRWQKVVEIAPCVSVDRSLVKRVIDAAVTMAKKVGLSSAIDWNTSANSTSIRSATYLWEHLNF